MYWYLVSNLQSSSSLGLPSVMLLQKLHGISMITENCNRQDQPIHIVFCGIVKRFHLFFVQTKCIFYLKGQECSNIIGRCKGIHDQCMQGVLTTAIIRDCNSKHSQEEFCPCCPLHLLYWYWLSEVLGWGQWEHRIVSMWRGDIW